MLDWAKFPASFAGDVSLEEAAFMADSQVPWGAECAGRRRERTSMEGETQLVPAYDRG